MESDDFNKDKSRSRPNSKINNNMSISEDNNILDVENINQNPNKKVKYKRKTYRIEQKLKIVNELKNSSIKALEKKYGISGKNIRRWRDQREELEKIKYKKFKNNIGGAGHPSQTLDIEQQLELFIKRNREIDIAVNSHEVVCEAIKLKPELINKSYGALMKWCYRFLTRIGYSIRDITHQAGELKKNSKELALNFFNYIYKLRREIFVNDKLELIGNVDETAIYYENIYNTTINKIGEKSVIVRTFGKDKLRITAVLCILANGIKLPPLLIFRGKTGGPKEKSLQSNIHCINKKIFIKCQPNAWTDHFLFSYWLNNIWFSANNYRYITNTILIMDRATTHFDLSINQLFDKYKSKFVLVPPGQTCFLQPLDVAINKQIKQFMKQEDALFRIQTNNMRAPNEHEIIDMFLKIWYDDSRIRKNTIIKSFKMTGISTKMNGSDKNEIELPEILIDEIPDPKNFIEENNSMMDDSDVIEMNENNNNRLNNNFDMPITNYFNVINK